MATANKFSRKLLNKISSISNPFKYNSNSIITTSSDSSITSHKSNNCCPQRSTCGGGRHPNTNASSFRKLNYSMNTCPIAGHSMDHLTNDPGPVSVKMPYEAVPTPKGLPLFGTILELIKSGGSQYMHLFCDERHQKLGPIYKETLGNVEGLFIADANLMQKVYQFEGKYPQHMVPEPWIIYNQINGIKRGLFFMDGPEWSDRRKSLNKVFLKSTTISEYTDLFNSVVTDFIYNWETLFDDSSNTCVVRNLEKELYNWSIESLGTMIFGRRLGCVAIRDNQTPISNIHEFVHCVQQIFVESANMQLIPPKLAYKLNLPVWKRFVWAAGQALALAKTYVKNNVQDIKNNPTNRLDSCQNSGQGIIRELLNEGTIDEEEIVRIIVDLFIAAADTTSHATQWALYLLSRNPQCQQKMLEEVNSATGGQQVQEKHLSCLPYVKGVIKESLRLYPVAPFLSRYLSHDLELSGYNIPAGKLVVMSLYTTGRMSKYFSNPNQFIPERWLRDKSSPTHQVVNSYACIPFGLGVRSCIGRRVAEIQMQFLLSRIVQKYILSSTDPNEIGIKLRMITTPEKPIHLVLHKRNND